MVTHVVKRSGRIEPYVEQKLSRSIERACLSVRALEGEAVLLAERVGASVSAWAHDKAEVTSRDLRARASELLQDLHADAEYAFSTHDLTI